MIRLIRFLFSGCFHKWEIHAKGVYKYNMVGNRGVGTYYTMRCSKCGEMKEKVFK